MDNQDNNQESSMRPWIIYLVIFGAIFMLLMAGRNKTEDSTEITYDQFIGMITNKVEGDDILIEAKIKFSQASELKEITGKSKETRVAETLMRMERRLWSLSVKTGRLRNPPSAFDPRFPRIIRHLSSATPKWNRNRRARFFTVFCSQSCRFC